MRKGLESRCQSDRIRGASYHVMARGNARQRIVRDGADRRRVIEGLEHAVIRYGWELPTFVVIGNHVHHLVKTSRRRMEELFHGETGWLEEGRPLCPPLSW